MRRHTIVVMPAATSVPDLLAVHGRWMTRGQLLRHRRRTEPLAMVLAELGYSMPPDGLAALRLWGQTGQRPGDWLCAADPVYFEAMLDHVRLHALDSQALDADDRQRLCEFLQQHVHDTPRKFCLFGGQGYLVGGAAFATAARSAALLDRAEPLDDLPTGAGASEHDRLTGELQMHLHESEFNRRRDARGQPPVNSVWFWGGGFAPQPRSIPLPPLYGDDALFRGYWLSAGANADGLPDSPERLPADVVANIPASTSGDSSAGRFFEHIKRQLLRGRILRLTFVFADGWLLRLGRWQLLAAWRGHAWPHWPEGSAT